MIDIALRRLRATTLPTKCWERTEVLLLDMWRKLDGEKKLQVLCYAERLALPRIRERLELERRRRRVRGDAKFQRFMSATLSAPAKNGRRGGA
jgi:hypothetical protein